MQLDLLKNIRKHEIKLNVLMENYNLIPDNVFNLKVASLLGIGKERAAKLMLDISTLAAEVQMSDGCTIYDMAIIVLSKQQSQENAFDIDINISDKTITCHVDDYKALLEIVESYFANRDELSHIDEIMRKKVKNTQEQIKSWIK